MALRALWVAAVLLVAATSCPAQDDEDRPKIFLEKKVYSSATQTGQRVFYETRTVGEGDTLWKILTSRGGLSPDQYAAQLREFRRINPSVADPDHLVPGQQLQVPLPPRATGEPQVREGRAVPHVVAKGQSLTRILRGRGVSRKEMPKYLGAVRSLNPTVRNVDRILAGKTIYLPTEGYFRPADVPTPPETASAAPKDKANEPKLVEAPPISAPPPTIAVTPAVPPATASEPTNPETPQAAALTREAPHEASEPDIAVGKPDAQLATPPPTAVGEELPASSVTGAANKAPEPVRPERPPYRGLLADVASALGEKWLDRGTLYLPMPAGGEVVINLADFPVVRFGTGSNALIDFRGSLPPDVRALVSETWKDYRIVPLDAVPGPGERIGKLLAASGYASIKEGMTHPLVIGESVAITLPARWQLFRTRQALEAGDVTLLKEVPEKLPADLDAVLTYAGRIGIRVLPVAWDTAAREGYLAGLAERKRIEAPDANRLPPGGLPALDAALALLKIPAETDPTLKVSGKDDAFRLVIRPERTFIVNGARYVVDTGRMSPAIRSLVKGAGFHLFGFGKGESAKMIFLRLLKASGHAFEEHRRFRVAGGPGQGFEVHITGSFITSKALLKDRSVKSLVVVKGRQHAATRALLRELGIEIIEWVD